MLVVWSFERPFGQVERKFGKGYVSVERPREGLREKSPGRLGFDRADGGPKWLRD